MKIRNFVLPMALAAGLIACSTMNPIPRDQLAANMAPVLRIEERFQQVRNAIQILGSLGWIGDETLKELKGHHDIYYVYYWASTVYLAGGNMESYLAHVRMAERELQAMETIIKDRLARNGNFDSGRKREFSGFNL